MDGVDLDGLGGIDVNKHKPISFLPNNNKTDTCLLVLISRMPSRLWHQDQLVIQVGYNKLISMM